MTGYSFSTPVWDGGTWVTPAVAEVAVTRKVNGPEDQPRKQRAHWLPAQIHAGENTGTTPTHVLFVELKDAGITGPAHRDGTRHAIGPS